MLLANISVAKKITECFPSVSVLRRHPAPSPKRFESFIRAAKLVNVEMNCDTSKHLADSLDRAVVPKIKNSNRIFRILATRCMNQAVYFVSGEVEPSERRHYGLATPIYTHFTSPIRRYADVIVHRMLAVAIGIESMPTGYSEKSFIRDLTDNCNRRNYAAQMAGRASVQLYTRVFFRESPRTVVATVLGVRKSGIAVIVMEFGFEGFVRLESVEDGGDWIYDAEKMSLVRSNNGGQKISIFQEVELKLEVRKLNAFREEVVLTLMGVDDLVDERKTPPKKRRRR